MKHKCTIRRAVEVIAYYKEEIARLGELASAVSRAYIYEKVATRVHLSVRTIQQFVNHSDEYRDTELDE